MWMVIVCLPLNERRCYQNTHGERKTFSHNAKLQRERTCAHASSLYLSNQFPSYRTLAKLIQFSLSRSLDHIISLWVRSRVRFLFEISFNVTQTTVLTMILSRHLTNSFLEVLRGNQHTHTILWLWWPLKVVPQGKWPLMASTTTFPRLFLTTKIISKVSFFFDYVFIFLTSWHSFRLAKLCSPQPKPQQVFHQSSQKLRWSRKG